MGIGNIKVDLNEYIEDINVNLCDNCANLTPECELQVVKVDNAGITSNDIKCKNFHFKERTEMIQKCRDLMNEIDEKFKPFTEIFWEQHRDNITEEEMLSQMRIIVAEMNDETTEEFNTMASMFSNCNCGWDSYRTGRIVHDLLIEKWYPRGR